MSNVFRALFCAIAVSAIGAGHASAHAHLQTSAPSDKASVSSPEEIDLTFSEGLNAEFSAISLLGPDGKAVALGQPMLMDDNKMMMAPVPNKLKPGTYRVDWHVLSNDGHKTKGVFSFTVTP